MNETTFLNEVEKNEIQKFLQNKTLKDAVRKVLLRGVYFQGVLEEGKEPNMAGNFALELVTGHMAQQGMINNEALGQDLRARWEAIRIVQNGFTELDKLEAKVAEVKETKNPAR